MSAAEGGVIVGALGEGGTACPCVEAGVTGFTDEAIGRADGVGVTVFSGGGAGVAESFVGKLGEACLSRRNMCVNVLKKPDGDDVALGAGACFSIGGASFLSLSSRKVIDSRMDPAC